MNKKSSYLNPSLKRVGEIKTERKNILECDLCGKEMTKPQSIDGGGIATFCGKCVRELEKRDYLKKNGNGSLELKDNLLDILAEYPTI